MLYSFALALTLISVATALICGGIILLSDLPNDSSKCAARDYYAVGKYYDSLSSAKAQSQAYRASGRAGYVLAGDDGFLLISAVYCSSSDARTVADRLGETVQTLSVPRLTFSEDDRDVCAEAAESLHEAVGKTETMWRELDADETSESLTAKTMQSYAAAINGYKNASEGVGELCVRAAAILVEAATGGDFSMSADVKYASAAIVALLLEYDNAV